MSKDRRVVSARELLAQRNALITLSLRLAQDAPGGVLSAGVEVLSETLSLRGGLAYRVDPTGLALVAESNLPRKAHAWLKHLPLGDSDPWFVAQRVAQRVRSEVDTELAKERVGVSIAPLLREEGWRALAAVPVAVGRHLKGVVVLASEAECERETMRVLEAAGALLALALEREEQRERESERLEEEATTQLATVGLVAKSVFEDLELPLSTLRLQLDYYEQLVRHLRALGSPPETVDALSELGFEMGASVRRVRDLALRLEGGEDTAPGVAVDMARVIRKAVAMMHAHAEARGVRMQLDIQTEEIAVEGREAELRMLVVQLLLHAVRNCLAADDPRVIVTLADEGDRCALAVETPGRGETDKRSGIEIFEALVARGGGTELDRIGLNLAKQTVIAHDGHMEVGRSPLGGLQIRAVLPTSALVPPEEESVPGPTLSPEAESSVVLWIDGDEMWTGAARRFLEGYEVRTASSMIEANALLRALNVVPQAVFCAVELPDGSGLELHGEAPQGIAERFVFVSDGVLPLETARYLRDSGCPTLIKPLTIDEVIALLEERQSYPDGRSSGAPTLRPASSSRPPEPSDPLLE